MERKKELFDDLTQLARVALTGREQDIHLFIYKLSKKYKDIYPEFNTSLVSILQEAPTRATPLRKKSDIPVPVDSDTRLQLLKIENPVLEHGLILPANIEAALNQIIAEREDISTLLSAGLQPTKSILLTGPPGVGKTMAAKWIANAVGKPLLVLDLTAVMSSFLGKTGNNLRQVLDYAKGLDCVLLLDELDAIAKRRDDNSEVGELKRLVTVLLQEIDDWPYGSLLLAATNHSDLLDPAVWRRFEVVLPFTLPSVELIEQFISMLLMPYTHEWLLWSKILSLAFKGRSFSNIEHEILMARKASVLNKKPLEEYFLSILHSRLLINHDEKVKLASDLVQLGVTSQRKANEITGISRDTIRKYVKTDSVKK